VKPVRDKDATIGRRDFLARVACATPPLLLSSHAWLGGGSPNVIVRSTRIPNVADELSADVVVVGGGLGGCAAALAAARNGLRVIMTEETDWIGGQLTQQAVPPDENQWIESIGATQSYQALRSGIRDYYRHHYTLTARAMSNPRLNPGNGWVSRVCAEPRVCLDVLNGMLAPFVASGRLRILLHHKAVRAETHGDRITAVHAFSSASGRDVVLNAKYYADATELGDLLPLSRTEYRVGSEAQNQTDEPHAKSIAQRDNMQGFTMCFAMEYVAGEDHTIDRPRDYAYWRDYTITAADGSPLRLLSFDEPEVKRIGFDPDSRKGFWSYRRIIDRDLFVGGTPSNDVTIVNWSQNDYSFGLLCDVSSDTAARHIDRAKQLSLSLLYWLQTQAPRPDGGTGWRGLRLRPDIVGTADGLAKYPYIRESRRIDAEFTVLEQHVTTEARMHATGSGIADVRAMPFSDTVGIGHYSMDLHLTTTGDRGRYGSTLPFQIPLGALIPRRVENLLPACKNIGVTHLTNGCYRLHPIEWNIGESVGSLVAFAQTKKQSPRAVRNRPALLTDFQRELERAGVRLAWPDTLPK